MSEYKVQSVLFSIVKIKLFQKVNKIKIELKCLRRLHK